MSGGYDRVQGHRTPPGWNCWPPGDPDGVQCGTIRFRCTREADPDGWRDVITIDQADPRVIASDEVVHGASAAGSRLHYDRWEIGELVRFVGDNRTVTYRIVDRDEAHCCWLLEWPD